MSSFRRLLSFLAAGAAVGCTAAPPPAAPVPETTPPAIEEAVEAPAPQLTHGVVWTAMANIAIRTEHGIAAISHPLTRLEVLEADSATLRIRCVRCEVPLEGWVERASVIYEPSTPAEAASGELAGFALALRKAALERNLAALHPVMYERFTFSFGGGGGPADAFTRWRFENFRTLDQLAPLLDRGLASFDGEIWSAPPEFATRVQAYMALREQARSRVGQLSDARVPQPELLARFVVQSRPMAQPGEIFTSETRRYIRRQIARALSGIGFVR
jgi:hypothetical protein